MNKRINEIDLLRFFAALSVVFFHYAFRGYAADDMSIMPYPLLARFAKYGYLGVNLFFMISGFVILMSITDGSLKKFLVSRVVRLYPAFWISCTITYIVTLAIGGERYLATISQYLFNMTMLGEFFSVPLMDGAYWSLFVEIKFYLLIAVFLLLFKKIDHAELFFLAWLIASISLEFFYHNGYLYYWLAVEFAAYFIAGAFFFLIWSKGLSFTRVIAIAVSWGLAVTQTLASTALFEKHYKTPINKNLVIEIITLFFLVMLFVTLKKTGWFGRARWTAIGALTYPLYLLHENIGFMIFNISYPAINAHILFWGMIFLMFGISYVVSFFEKKVSPSFKNSLNRLFIPKSP